MLSKLHNVMLVARLLIVSPVLGLFHRLKPHHVRLLLAWCRKAVVAHQLLKAALLRETRVWLRLGDSGSRQRGNVVYD